jgi:polysaccharide export outer membrane protein
MSKYVARIVMCACSLAVAFCAAPVAANAQNIKAPEPDARPLARAADGAASAGPVVTPPNGYVIGPEDHLSIIFFADKDMSSDVIVRPDGKISLALLNDVQASGLTPDQLREVISEQAKRFIQSPRATVIVRAINSRKVFITGAVEKPGSYPLSAPTTVLQLIATAGGLKEYADGRKIKVIRAEADGRSATHDFNYKDVVTQGNMKQNIALMPGDTVVVP